MKGIKINFLVLVLFCISIVWMSCSSDDSPTAPTTLSGTYTFVLLTDKEDDTTIGPGDTVEVSGLQATVQSGQIIATDTNFTFTFTVDLGGGTLIPLTATGTYQLNGSEITIDVTQSTIPIIEVGEVTFDITLTSSTLILENADAKLEFSR